MKQRVTISFVEDDEYLSLEDNKAFWCKYSTGPMMLWMGNASEINVSVVPASRGYSTVADLRKHYGCDDGGAQ